MNEQAPNNTDGKIHRMLDKVRLRLLAGALLRVASRNVLAALILIAPAAVYAAIHPASGVVGAVSLLCAAALVLACIEALLKRPGRLDAALHLDRKFNLHERISTLVSPPKYVSQPMLAALETDALAVMDRIATGELCPVGLPRTAPFTGAALFAVAILLFGTAHHGTAGRNHLVRHELEEMMTPDQSYARFQLSPELQAKLDELLGDEVSDLDAALAQLDASLARLKAADALEAEMVGVDSVDEILAMLQDQPDARERLQEALHEALEHLSANDPEFAALVEAALQADSDDALAAAVSDLAARLRDQTANQDAEDVSDLRRILASRQDNDDDKAVEGGVSRGIGTGGSPSDERAELPPLSFPPGASIRAQSAVRSGDVPARYRWAVEAYFSTDADERTAR